MDHNISRRNTQYHNILSSLIFRSSDPLAQPAQVFDTSHLFVMGDLNYRFSRIPQSGYPSQGKASDDIVTLEKERLEMVELDTLRKEQREGRVFGGLREGDLSRFAPTYKRIVGQVGGYSRYVPPFSESLSDYPQETYTRLHRSDIIRFTYRSTSLVFPASHSDADTSACA